MEIDVVGIGGFKAGGAGGLTTEEVQKMKLMFEAPDNAGDAKRSLGALPGTPLHVQGSDIDLVKALNAFEGLTQAKGFEFPQFFSSASVEKGLTVLRSYRDAMLNQRFGTDRYHWYQENRHKYIETPDAFSASEREILSELHSAYESQFDQ